ncbi:MAG TPA: cyanophycin synthetase [Actinomycetota bacterium]|nr:cyanophycin synthetase [Actinomycetota bacterium]
MSLTPKQAHAFLDARGFGITPGLARIEALTRLLSEPQLNFLTIHLAGTNGKTSTARILTSILAGHGLSTGLYTSPHLHDVRERFVLAGWDEGPVWDTIDEQEFADTLTYLLPFIQIVEDDLGEQMTYFEITTAMAFEWMSERSVAAGVIETGLGGRWDATNLVRSSVSVLTPVDVDHAAYLGNTPAANGSEKVDIVKAGSTVVSAAQTPEVMELLDARTTKVGAKLLVLGADFHIASNETAVGGRAVTIKTPNATYEDLFLPLHGAHQGVNLALAVAAAEAFLGKELDYELLSSSLLTVSSPGRLEVVGRKPLIVLDGAHNPHAALALRNTLSSDFLFKNLTIVLSIFEDKDIKGVLDQLVPAADRVILTRGDNPRFASPETLRDLAPVVPGQDPPELAPTMADALDRARSISDEEDMILLTGSLHGVGDARSYLLGDD